MKKILLSLLFLMISVITYANISVTNLVSDHMVLQRDSQATIWGWTATGNTVSVNPSWGDVVTSVAGSGGLWSVKIPTGTAGGPYTLIISDVSGTINISDILIGEVWLCTGQSNMAYKLVESENSTEEIANAKYLNMRWFQSRYKTSGKKEAQVFSQSNLGWRKVTPSNVPNMSAIAYFFGRKLHKDLNVPIGLISSSWGSTPAQTWMGEEAIKTVTGYTNFKQSDIALNSPSKKLPTASYNAMIHPMIPYTIKGAIWYQGESNTNKPAQYKELLPALIAGWRSDWNQGDFPFYIVQIAPYNYGLSKNSAELREAQLISSQTVINTGLVVQMDVNEPSEIHPINKIDAGERLALWALAKDYGQSSIIYSGPEYKSISSANGEATIDFEYVHGGLVLNSPTENWEIAGANNQFVPATARIEGSQIVVSATNVSQPKEVRYAWTNTANGTLFNTSGLPASSFRASIDNPLGVNTINYTLDKKSVLYPNPISTGNFIIDIKGYENNVSVKIFDTIGRSVYKTETRDNKLILNSSIFKAKGIYILNLASKNKTETIKLLFK